MNDRYWRAHDQFRADQAVIHEAADVLRDPTRRADLGGFPDGWAEPMAGLLEVLAGELAGLDDPVRGHIARVAREMTGSPMDQATVRRTRRRR